MPADQLADANGLQQTLQQVMRLVTPALGIGVLARFGAHAVVLADTAAFGVAAACLAAISIPEPRPVGRPGWIADAGTGFRYIWRTPVLRQTISASAVLFLAFGIFGPFGMDVITVGLHHAPAWLAVLTTEQGLFGAAGALAAASVARRIGEFRLTVIAIAGMAASCSVFAVPDSATVFCAMAIFALFLPWFFVGAATLMQKNTPGELAGRVSGARSLAVQAPQAAGNLAGAGLVLALSYRDLAFLLTLLMALTALYLGTRPSLRGPVIRAAASGPVALAASPGAAGGRWRGAVPPTSRRRRRP